MPVVDQEGAENKHVSVDIMVKENQLLADARIRSTSYRNVDIFDIRLNREEQSLLMAINQGLRPAAGGEKTLPTLLLYDQTGLKLFEEITYLQDYYLTNAEIEVLEHYADEIAQRLQQDSIVLELGSGNLRKVDILLRALDRCGKEVDYYGLDLSLSELQRSLSAISKVAYKHVRCFGLLGTYDDGLEWLKQPQVKFKAKAVLSLGSSIGNFSRPEAAKFLRGFADILRPSDLLIIGVDACKDAGRVHQAYNDREGLTHKFILNGLLHANQIMRADIFDIHQWKVIGEYNEIEGRHQAFVVPTTEVRIGDIIIKKEEKVRIEESYKYASTESTQLWKDAGTVQIAQWCNQTGDYSMHMLSKTTHAFPWDPRSYAAGPVPTWAEWEHLWQLWDAVTRKMIPDEELIEKPIKLRNACIFYLGHIPTFLDMKLTDTTDGIYTEPSYYSRIFERGIDPNVDNPEQCHAHSEVPDKWPSLDEILAYQRRVRNRVKCMYDSNASADARIGRTLWLGYEHECMHLETLLYMLIQSDKTLAPPDTPEPTFEALWRSAQAQAVPNEWITVPESSITIGMDDLESTADVSRYFGWDAEKPSSKIHVRAFSTKARPISIRDYAHYLHETGSEKFPASWSADANTNGHTNDNGQSIGEANGHLKIDSVFLQGKTVKTVYGPVALAFASEWPVSASYDELLGCAQWMGGRIPSLEEVRSIYRYAEQSQAAVKNALNNTIPAVNGHLINDGVEETPPAGQVTPGAGAGLNPLDAFVDLKGCNVGFQHWHPTPVTQNGGKLCGQSDMGGVWEWTCTPLSKHEGFEPMPLYPAYSQDFHDGKHNIVLGGSWATPPRIAGRKSFVNWYQRNYPYVWAGARVVRDLE